MCDGTRAFKEHAQLELKALPGLGRQLVVLTDPDERGRWARLPCKGQHHGAIGQLVAVHA